MFSSGKFAKKIGVTSKTLRTWHKNRSLIPVKITDGGTRYYSESQYFDYMGGVHGYAMLHKNLVTRISEDVFTFSGFSINVGDDNCTAFGEYKDGYLKIGILEKGAFISKYKVKAENAENNTAFKITKSLDLISKEF